MISMASGSVLSPTTGVQPPRERLWGLRS
jgi:hypothetical protein